MTEGEELKVVTIPSELYAFLMGEGEIDGTSFGDLNANLPGRFWWRALLRTAANTRTPTAAPSDEVVERVAVAIERADRDKVPDGYADGVSDHEEVSDWGVYLARAALSAIEGEKK